MSIRPFHSGDEAAVVALWRATGLTVPWNDPALDIATYVASGQQAFFVATDASAIVGTAMAGFDGHRGWIYYLGVAPSHRRRGIATDLVHHCEHVLRERGCPKINLMVRGGNDDALEFYRSLGYEPSDVSTLGQPLR